MKIYRVFYGTFSGAEFIIFVFQRGYDAILLNLLALYS